MVQSGGWVFKGSRNSAVKRRKEGYCREGKDQFLLLLMGWLSFLTTREPPLLTGSDCSSQQIIVVEAESGEMEDRDQVTPYRQSVDEVLTSLGTDAKHGLSREEARERLERYGINGLTVEKPIPRWRKFLAQFQDVLVILLRIATLISAGLWLYERESTLPYEAMAIFAVVLLNAVLGYIQESRAEQAVAALRQMSAAHANVIRDGRRSRARARR
jgi:magnesium-transporting ATPase (P-type)